MSERHQLGEQQMQERVDVNYDSEGRVDEALLARSVQSSDAHYFRHGPIRLMTNARAGLCPQQRAPHPAAGRSRPEATLA